MDAKSVFLNDFINEEVYVTQPLGFEDYKFLGHVYKLKKTLNELKQAPQKWYERLSNFLLSQSYERGKVDKTLLFRKDDNDIILVQVYVNDIICCSTNKKLCQEFVAAM